MSSNYINEFMTLLDDFRTADMERSLEMECSNDFRAVDVRFDHLRGIYWRIMLGKLITRDANDVALELLSQVDEFHGLKKKMLPNIENVESDPLAALSTNSKNDWKKYYEDIDLIKFIQGDLERLFINGVPEQYFQSKSHQEILVNVLFIWSLMHAKTSYRQGMHEIAAVVLYVMDNELNSWNIAVRSNPQLMDHRLTQVFNNDCLDAHTFWVFEGLMNHLEVLYTPPPPKSETPPFVVQFCNHLQEELLAEVDTKLSRHLSASGVQAQLYGLRWSRLMHCRELPLNNSQLIRLWDRLISSCFGESEEITGVAGISGGRSSSVVYNDSPLLKTLGDSMVALTLSLRIPLMSGGPNEVTVQLMRPQTNVDVNVILLHMEVVKTARIALQQSQGQKQTEQTSQVDENGFRARSVLPLLSGSVATDSSLPPFPTMPSRKQQSNRALGSKEKTGSATPKPSVPSNRATDPLLPSSVFSSDGVEALVTAKKPNTRRLVNDSMNPLAAPIAVAALQDSELQTFSTKPKKFSSSSAFTDDLVMSVEARLRDLAIGLRSRSRPTNESEFDYAVSKLLTLADVLAGRSSILAYDSGS